MEKESAARAGMFRSLTRISFIKDNYEFVASTREMFSEMSKEAKSDMSDLKAAPLISFPLLIFIFPDADTNG